MAYALHVMGYYQASKHYFEQVLSLSPHNARSYYYLADIAYRGGNYEDAYQYCRNALFFENDFKQAYLLLAKIYYRSENFKDAEEILDNYGIVFSEFAEQLDNE
jgi:tetratricopeptide (TPR) repeat protein